MKKTLSLLLCAAMTLSLAACGTTANNSSTDKSGSASTQQTDTAPSTIVVKSLNANDEVVDVEVPYNPQRAAVFNLAVLDMLDVWGLGDRVVGMPKATEIDYLASYYANTDIANLGTLKEADMEALMSSEPDIIFISGRLSAQYDALSAIAPVVYTDTGHETGYMKTTQENIQTVASIFGQEDKSSQIIAEFNTRIDALAAVAKGKSAVVGLVTSSSFNTLGNGARGSIIGNEIGFENLANDVDSTHGNESSFELLVKLNPDYIFVIDRDSAINAEGASLAKDVLENELVAKTTAYQNKQIVYLTPSVWYLVEGGITSTDLMLKDLESALLA